MARLLLELGRWASRHPSAMPQGLIFLDEADLYLPATSKPATKEPMEDLLKRARSAGLGVFLATQSPGDLDYKCRDNILTWLVGKVTQKTALEKLRPVLSNAKIDPSDRIPKLTTGEFFFATETEATFLRVSRSLMKTRQLSEDEILTAAKATAGKPPLH